YALLGFANGSLFGTGSPFTSMTTTWKRTVSWSACSEKAGPGRISIWNGAMTVTLAVALAVPSLVVAVIVTGATAAFFATAVGTSPRISMAIASGFDEVQSSCLLQVSVVLTDWAVANRGRDVWTSIVN